jgi:hypothetical protein
VHPWAWRPRPRAAGGPSGRAAPTVAGGLTENEVRCRRAGCINLASLRMHPMLTPIARSARLRWTGGVHGVAVCLHFPCPSLLSKLTWRFPPWRRGSAMLVEIVPKGSRTLG